MRESTNEIVHKTNAVRKEEVSQPDHVPSRDKLNDKDERKSKRQLSRAIVAPPTREEREERTKYGDISKIRTELSADTITADHEDERLEAYKPKGEQPQPMLMQRGHARLQEVSASSELARNYKIVREGLLPQDRRGRVNSIGGACRKALQELENAAGNHRE